MEYKDENTSYWHNLLKRINEYYNTKDYYVPINYTRYKYMQDKDIKDTIELWLQCTPGRFMNCKTIEELDINLTLRGYV